MRFSRVNPVAKAMLSSRRRTQVVPNRKRKEKHDRNKLKEKDRKAQDTGHETDA